MRFRGWGPQPKNQTAPRGAGPGAGAGAGPAAGTIVFFAATLKPIPVPTGGGMVFPGDRSQPTIVDADMNAPALVPPDQEGVCLRFWQVNAKDPDMQGALDAIEVVTRNVLGHLLPADPGDPIQTPPGRVTVIEMATPIPQVEAPAQVAFRRCFAAVEDVSRAFGNALRSLHTPVELSDLAPIALFAAPSNEADADHQLSIYLIPGSLPDDYVSVDQLDTEDVGRFSVHLRRLRQGDPFTLATERAQAANVAAHAGDFGTAVLHYAVASEILLDAVLSAMLWEEDADLADARVALGRTPSQWLGREFPERLGGTWSQDGDGAVALWRTAIANARNRVVHRGYRPTEQESGAATAAFRSFDEHLRARLCDRRMRYPRTALLLLGEPGLKRLGGWSKKMRAQVAELDEDPETWITTHVAWRDRVDGGV